ncbi:MAG TPA: NfeD family protein [Accumulibacter sp.]|nr:NfeD family protein [Accumulibacter sp.]HMW17417.1 NfeD family protein [Accumulibacter sp.]HMX22019.1 NfeD family protein [Accumulibacter sp.]HMY06604.1 NfeD family protein [Accumulibacter sp.]HNC17812.1 NfeD family protein [Accumulibacter sp.]
MFTPDWWQWLAFGLLLMTAEMLLPALLLIWIGLAAMAVGLVLLALPELSLASQIFLWAGLSVALLGLWFRFLKPRTVSTVGSSATHAIGEVGVLINELTPHNRGQVRFQKPLLGADCWECYADSTIAAGERVRVVAIEGNFVKVEHIR